MTDNGNRPTFVPVIIDCTDMEHVHHHHDHAHVHQLESLNGVYIFSIVLNLLFVAVEVTMGFFSNSLGLISDAGHNLGDVFSLLLAMIAFKLSTSHSTRRYTYGYKKSSVLISLLNAIILLVAVGAIIIESIHKFSSLDSYAVNGAAVSWTAGVGIVINGLTAWLLSRNSKHDINTRGAFLHMLADTLVSVGVVISGIVISLTGWNVIDPIVSLIIAAVILVSTWKLLSESLRLSIDAVPEDIDPDKVNEAILACEGVSGVHHVHIWPISTTENALTAHVVINDVTRMHEIGEAIKEELIHKGISHSTLEMESEGSECDEQECGAHHHHHHHDED